MFACFFEQVVRFINTFSFHSLFQITISKPKLGIDLLLNTWAPIFQVIGKEQPFLIVFNGLLKQFHIFNSLGLFEIANTKPRLGINLLLNAVLFICQLLGKL